MVRIRIALSRKTFGMGHVYIYTFLFRMTDTVTFPPGTSVHRWMVGSKTGKNQLWYNRVTILAFASVWLVCSCCSHLKHRASVKRFVSLQFLNLRYSVGLLGRVFSSSQGCYLTQTQNKHRQTSMPRVGFEPTIPAFERENTVHALDRAVTVNGHLSRGTQKKIHTNPPLWRPMSLPSNCSTEQFPNTSSTFCIFRSSGHFVELYSWPPLGKGYASCSSRRGFLALLACPCRKPAPKLKTIFAVTWRSWLVSETAVVSCYLKVSQRRED
jgi:hypothetical protein